MNHYPKPYDSILMTDDGDFDIELMLGASEGVAYNIRMDIQDYQTEEAMELSNIAASLVGSLAATICLLNPYALPDNPVR